MNDLRKAAEMALEVLMKYDNDNTIQHYVGIRDSITALRQALAMERFSEVSQEIEEALKQEPVAWQVMVEDEALKEFPMKDMANDWCVHKKLSGSSCAYWIRPLYTAPPKREWVGFTNEEKHELNDALNLQGRFPIIETIESKLKEKNSG
jgi:hypothetical protein